MDDLHDLPPQVGEYDKGVDPVGEDYPKWLALVDHLKVRLLNGH